MDNICRRRREAQQDVAGGSGIRQCVKRWPCSARNDGLRPGMHVKRGDAKTRFRHPITHPITHTARINFGRSHAYPWCSSIAPKPGSRGRGGAEFRRRLLWRTHRKRGEFTASKDLLAKKQKRQEVETSENRTTNPVNSRLHIVDVYM